MLSLRIVFTLTKNNMGTLNNLCPLCGLPYDINLESGVNLTTGEKWCRHDDGLDVNVHFDNWDRKIIAKLPAGQVLAKTSDGISRVCEVMPKKVVEAQAYYKKKYENKYGKSK